MKPRIDKRAVIISVEGQFNPAILHPAWFSHHNLIKPAEADQAEIRVVHPELTDFSTDWFRLYAQQNRFELTSSQEAYFETLRDLAVGTFRLLSHTPISSFTVADNYHFSYEDPRSSARVLHTLIPAAFQEDGALAKTVEKPFDLYTLRLTVPRSDGRLGELLCAVEPSRVIANGLFVAVTSAVDISPDLVQAAPPNAGIVTEDLAKVWEDSINLSNRLALQVASLE